MINTAQPIKNKIEWSHSFSAVCFFIIATISNLVTTELSYFLILIIRSLAAFLLVLSVSYLVAKRGVNNRQLGGSVVLVALTTYAYLLSLLNRSEISGAEIIARNTALIWMGVYIVFFSKTPASRNRLPEAFAIYCLCALIFTWLIGGVGFDGIPRFNFEYGASLIGRDEDYSLGISFFFGLGSISAALAITEKTSLAQKSFYFLLTTVFFLICLLGGGRGEAASATLVLLIILLTRKKSRILICCLATAILFAIWVLAPNDTLDALPALQRFKALIEGDLSSRDSLIFEAINLLSRNPGCLLFGCGFNFFETYYSYQSGMHPHNSFMEFAITFGLPLAFLAYSVFIFGLFRYYKLVKKVDLLLAVSLFVALVSLKSQSLHENWLFTTSVFYFFWIAIGGKNNVCKIEHEFLSENVKRYEI